MLKVGDKLPAFSLPSDDGRTVSSRDFAAKPLVVYFYPRDSTPGCTREGQAFSRLLPEFRKAGVEVLGVSRDSVESHGKFRAKFALTVPLLSDPDLSLHEAFGAYGEKVMYGKKVKGVLRSTFVFREGKAVKVYPSVKVDGHAEAVLAFFRGETAPAGDALRDTRSGKPAPAKKPAPARNALRDTRSGKSAPGKGTRAR